MKNTAINSLGYTGIVTLSQYIQNNKIPITKAYNKGRSSLFNFLSDCLKGDFELAKLSLPSNIMLLNAEINSETGEIDQFTAASGVIALSTIATPEKALDESSGRVRYSFIVTRDQLETESFNAIGLYAKGIKPEYCQYNMAYCILDESVNSANLSVSSALVVDWDLIITNNS